MGYSRTWEKYAYLLFDPYELMAPTSFPFPPIIGAYTEWDMCKGLLDTVYEESLRGNDVTAADMSAGIERALLDIGDIF